MNKLESGQNFALSGLNTETFWESRAVLPVVLNFFAA